MGKGGGTHTHILLLATAEEAGGTSGWSGVHRSLLLLFRFLLLFNAADLSLSGERERERAESHTTTTGVCCTHHTARAGREQGVPYTAAAVSFRRRRREERYWLVGSLWVHRLVSCVVVLAAAGACMHPFCRGGRRRHTSHHAPATTLVPRKWSTTYCCAVHLSTLIVGERVCRLCCCCCC